MKRSIIIGLLFLFVLLTVFPLQAGKNLFRPEKEQKSGNSETPPDHKTKVSPEQLKKWEIITRSMQQGNSRTAWSYFLLTVSLILTAVLFYLLHQYYWKQHVLSLDNPWNLFRELCAAHKLTRLERQILRHIAEERHWDSPLPIFIEPSHLKSALTLKRFEKSQSLIESLLEKLFDFDLKNDLSMETQAIERYSPLTTTIVYQKEMSSDKELSGIRVVE
ncbi:MAG: hypothetical protein LBI18_04280 [Planctomycetaceae bacterium]|jgi:hypothetical protein|nr:hypothetical protein [Planctomycetaceae bacterium]